MARSKPTTRRAHALQEVPLATLLLDPNNFRFVDRSEYKNVEESKIAGAQVQRRALNLVLGPGQSNIVDLIDSFKANGWLPVDQIQVRKHSKGGYVVVEGNRRIATLKYLKAQYDQHEFDLGALSPTIFDRVPVVTYEDGDKVHYLKLMGLKHISGNLKWPPLNQAKLLLQLKESGLKPDEICKAVSITRRTFNLSLKTLRLIDLYRESDYGDQFRSDQYNLFREVMNSSKLRAWIGWDDDALAARNRANLERLFAWISPVEGDDGAMREAVVVKEADMRALAEIVDDPKALDRLDRTRDLLKAREGSTELQRRRARDTLDSAQREVNELFALSNSFGDKELDEVDQLIKSLRGVAAARGRFPAVFQDGASALTPFNQFPARRFESVIIHDYRGHSGTELRDLRRINLLAGVNNAGKTSALEAMHLLAKQHDVTGVLDIVRQRARVDGREDPRWLVEQLPAHAKITGHFDTIQNGEASVEMSYRREANVEDQAFYLGTLAIDARYGGHIQRSESEFYENRDRRLRMEGGANVLCRSVLYSPFSTGDPALLAACNKRSVETRTKDAILTFLRERIDDGIVNIEMVDTWQRFMVTHQRIAHGIDLAQFGDGMQRVFLMCLLFAWAEHGVVLLDEFENAIHASLLPPVARFISDLSKKFNTQVFLTSHSKEAIDSILRCGLGDDVSAYSLFRDGHQIRARHYSGSRMERLLELADFDLRKV